MLVCTRLKSGSVSPGGGHFLWNYFLIFWRYFVLFSYTFFSSKNLFSYFFYICYSDIPAGHRLSHINQFSLI